MASNIRVGQQVRVSVRFIDFDPTGDVDELIAPTSVSGAIYKYNSTTEVYDLQGVIDPIVNDSLGLYHYDWTTPDNGKFKLLFIGTLTGATPSTIENPRVFYVGTSEPTITLGSTYQQLFLGELDPLYIDPDWVVEIFPEVDLVEVTEIIYKQSLQLEEWFGQGLTITSLMREYLIAATLCELSKTYLIDGGINGFGKSDSFSLGDLTINNGFGGGSGGSRNSVYRGNATTWCEMAYALKAELLKSKVTFSTVVKGSNFVNPIPSRSLRKFD